jgi:hypothetical protein
VQIRLPNISNLAALALLREMMAFVTSRMVEAESLTGAACRVIRCQIEAAHRLSRSGLQYAGRHHPGRDLQAPQRQLFPVVPGAAAARRRRR